MNSSATARILSCYQKIRRCNRVIPRYAKNGLILLNNYETSGTELYHYTTGSIEAEDFTVKSGTAVWFKTNEEPVLLKEGFFVEPGAEFLITTDGN